MPLFEKKLNKRIIGAVIGTTIVGVGAAASMTPQGKSFRKRVKEFFEKWIKQMNKELGIKPKKK